MQQLIGYIAGTALGIIASYNLINANNKYENLRQNIGNKKQDGRLLVKGKIYTDQPFQTTDGTDVLMSNVITAIPFSENICVMNGSIGTAPNVIDVEASKIYHNMPNNLNIMVGLAGFNFGFINQTNTKWLNIHTCTNNSNDLTFENGTKLYLDDETKYLWSKTDYLLGDTNKLTVESSFPVDEVYTMCVRPVGDIYIVESIGKENDVLTDLKNTLGFSDFKALIITTATGIVAWNLLRTIFK